MPDLVIDGIVIYTWPLLNRVFPHAHRDGRTSPGRLPSSCSIRARQDAKASVGPDAHFGYGTIARAPEYLHGRSGSCVFIGPGRRRPRSVCPCSVPVPGDSTPAREEGDARPIRDRRTIGGASTQCCMRAALALAALLVGAEVTGSGQALLPPAISAVGALLAALLTAMFSLATAVVTHVLTRRAERERSALALSAKELEVRQQLASQYDADLRARRFKAYASLWRPLEPLALYTPPSDVTYQDLDDLASHLRRWYFARGGLLLSEEARECYFDLQDALTRALRAADEAQLPRTQVIRRRDLLLTRSELDGLEAPGAEAPNGAPAPAFLHVRRATSALRSALCVDLGSRAAPLPVRDGSTAGRLGSPRARSPSLSSMMRKSGEERQDLPPASPGPRTVPRPHPP